MPDVRLIAISVAPAPSSVAEYYQKVVRSVIVTNVSDSRLLVEDIALRFQSDFGQAAVPVRKECHCELAPGDILEQGIEIMPTPLFLAATNAFDVKVRFRIMGDTVGNPNHEVFSQQAYLVIREPLAHIGRLFISLKQPEDLELGRFLARMARRAGFEVFLKADNERPAADIWRDTIEPALSACDILAVIWTENTDWNAAGVQREIELARALGKREALLLANDTTKPRLYDNTTVEYSRFSIDDPARHFADAADRLRQLLLR
jgi:hypothetical protein